MIDPVLFFHSLILTAGDLYLLFLPISFAPSTAGLLIANFTSGPWLTSSNTSTPLWTVCVSKLKRPIFTASAKVLVSPLKITPIPLPV